MFVALDAELHREVALKESRTATPTTPTAATLLREAEITGGLEHPGIVPVYGLGQYDDGRPYYAMRFIPGDSLQEAIEPLSQHRGTETQSQRKGVGVAAVVGSIRGRVRCRRLCAQSRDAAPGP